MEWRRFDTEQGLPTSNFHLAHPPTSPLPRHFSNRAHRFQWAPCGHLRLGPEKSHPPQFDPKLGRGVELPLAPAAIEVTRAPSGPSPASPSSKSKLNVGNAMDVLVRSGYTVARPPEGLTAAFFFICRLHRSPSWRPFPLPTWPHRHWYCHADVTVSVGEQTR